jgi:hypothetical protein
VNSEAAREWFAENRYQDYLCLHGLSVGMAEALARIRPEVDPGELGFAGEEARDPEAIIAQGYRGSRYSFGHPACPNLADKSSCWRYCAPRKSASPVPKKTSSTPSNPPPPSSSTTRRRSTSRFEPEFPCRPGNAGKSHSGEASAAQVSPGQARLFASSADQSHLFGPRGGRELFIQGGQR